MKIKIEKKDGEFCTNIIQADGTSIAFNYISFLKELYKEKGLVETEYSDQIEENEREVMDNLFKRISEVFSIKDNQIEKEEVDY